MFGPIKVRDDCTRKQFKSPTCILTDERRVDALKTEAPAEELNASQLRMSRLGGTSIG